jgi:5-hydroxyisourate hydrolase-like protein (transthyretin family)
MVNINLTDDQFIQQANDAVEQLDGLRGDQLTFLYKLLSTKDKAMQAELQRLGTKYGQDYADNSKVAARIAFNRQLLPAIALHMQETLADTPAADPASWSVYGYLLDSTGAPAAKMTLALTDEKQQTVKKLPQAITDSRGYYMFTLNKDMVNAAKTKLSIALVARGKKPVVLTDAAMTPALGTTIYRELVMPADGGKTNK